MFVYIGLSDDKTISTRHIVNDAFPRQYTFILRLKIYRGQRMENSTGSVNVTIDLEGEDLGSGYYLIGALCGSFLLILTVALMIITVICEKNPDVERQPLRRQRPPRRGQPMSQTDKPPSYEESVNFSKTISVNSLPDYQEAIRLRDQKPFCLIPQEPSQTPCQHTDTPITIYVVTLDSSHTSFAGT